MNTYETLNIMIIGANGGIGRQTVQQALEAGHAVTALVRNPDVFDIQHPKLEVIKADIMKPETYETSLKKQHVIISAIGSHMNAPTTLYSEGNRTLMEAMQRQGVTRAFFISASAIEISPVQPFIVRLATRFIVQKLFGHGYADQRIMEAVIRSSGINYTIVRPPRLTHGPSTGRYRFAANAFLPKCLSISRADVAHFILHHLFSHEIYRAVVEVAY